MFLTKPKDLKTHLLFPEPHFKEAVLLKKSEVALKNSSELRQKYSEIEARTERFENDMKLGKVLSDGTVEIPVVVNVLYRTTAENVSDARIAEQIAVLNADYAGTNTDVSKIPSEFQGVKAGDVKVRFRLANVVRKSTTKTSWSTNDAMKKASTGGIDATSPSNYLNIWTVGNMGQILGYATFPESSGLWNDGVVIASPYFGKTGASSPFNLGRTATHEVGHYLNLRHIWGDANCGNDLVAILRLKLLLMQENQAILFTIPAAAYRDL
jgi:hypothetical protein